MPHLVQVVCVYAVPAALEVTPSCFAKRFQAKIGGLNVQVTLPRLEWEGDEPHVIAPLMDAELARYIKHYVVDAQQGWESWHYWGRVSGYNPDKRKIIRAHLGAILLEFKRDPATISYSDYLHGRGHPQSTDIEGLFRNIDDWFEQLRTWVETALDQDADPIHSVLAPTFQAAGLHVFTIEGSTVSLPASAFNTVVRLSTFEPLSLSLFRKIIQLVSAGSTPSDAHLLLRDSRAELRRGRYRRAVIDAGSAVEITLADFNRNVTLIPTPPRPTLGWYTKNSTIAAKAKLPSNVNTDLVDIRNSAIHQNRTPTQQEATSAFALAKQVVDNLDPLPL